MFLDDTEMLVIVSPLYVLLIILFALLMVFGLAFVIIFPKIVNYLPEKSLK